MNSSADTASNHALPSWAKALPWIAIAVAAVSAVAGLASGPGNRFGWWDYRVAFSMVYKG